MSVTEQRIINWHKKTFTDVNAKKYHEKIREELYEGVFANEHLLEGDISVYDFAEEIADIIIVSTAFLHREHNISLDDIVKKKLTVNQNRKYKPDGSREK